MDAFVPLRLYTVLTLSSYAFSKTVQDEMAVVLGDSHFKDIVRDILTKTSEKYHVVFSSAVFYFYHHIFFSLMHSSVGVR